MKSKKRTLVGTALVLLLVAGCGGSPSSSGQPESSASAKSTETAGSLGKRELASFDAIQIDKGVTVDVTVAAGSQQAVVVEAPATYRGTVTTDVNDKTLSIAQQDTEDSEDSGPSITITIPALTSSDVEGGSSLTISGEAQSYNLTVGAGSSAKAGDFRAQQVDVDLTSGSSAEVFASTNVTGSVSDGSSLRVSGGGNLQVDVDSGSSVDAE